jgi:hypothetical protein
MKQHLKIIFTLSGLSISNGAFSHPFDSPLTFREHRTDDGRIILSNIEKRCFSKGKLTCLEYHPVWQGSRKSYSNRNKAKQTNGK